jgi:hypothetical protein
LLLYVGNLVHTPEETKYRSLRANNIHYKERLGNVPGGHECMQAIGYTIITDDGWMRIDDHKALSEDALAYFEKRLIETQTNLQAQVKVLPHRHPIDHQWHAVRAAACHSERGKRQTMEVCHQLTPRACRYTLAQHLYRMLNRMMKSWWINLVV